MKQVISYNHQITQNVFNVHSDKYYGTSISTSGRGFIMSRNYCGSNYTVFTPKRLTCGNGWNIFDKPTLVEIVENIIKSGHQVFEFDTFIELMTWVDKKD